MKLSHNSQIIYMGICSALKKNKKFIIIIILFLAAALLFVGWKPVSAPEIWQGQMRVLKVNGSDLSVKEGGIFKVEIADTDKKRIQGLSDRESLPENQGMLFLFNTPDNYSFWMKNMNFGLDFIWINGDRIVEMTQNVKPEDYQPPKVLVPKNKIDKVLEVNAGFIEKTGIKEGDKLEF